MDWWQLCGCGTGGSVSDQLLLGVSLLGLVVVLWMGGSSVDVGLVGVVPPASTPGPRIISGVITARPARINI